MLHILGRLRNTRSDTEYGPPGRPRGLLLERGLLVDRGLVMERGALGALEEAQRIESILLYESETATTSGRNS